MSGVEIGQLVPCRTFFRTRVASLRKERRQTNKQTACTDFQLSTMHASRLFHHHPVFMQSEPFVAVLMHNGAKAWTQYDVEHKGIDNFVVVYTPRCEKRSYASPQNLCSNIKRSTSSGVSLASPIAASTASNISLLPLLAAACKTPATGQSPLSCSPSDGISIDFTWESNRMVERQTEVSPADSGILLQTISCPPTTSKRGKGLNPTRSLNWLLLTYSIRTTSCVLHIPYFPPKFPQSARQPQTSPCSRFVPRSKECSSRTCHAKIPIR